MILGCSSWKWSLNSIEAIKNAVQSGLGAAFVSVSAIEKELELGLFQRVEVEGIVVKRMLSLIINPNRYRSKGRAHLYERRIASFFDL